MKIIRLYSRLLDGCIISVYDAFSVSLCCERLFVLDQACHRKLKLLQPFLRLIEWQRHSWTPDT